MYIVSPKQVSLVHLRIIAVPNKQDFWSLFVFYYCSMLFCIYVIVHFLYALMRVRDAVMSHTCLSWSDYLTAWCCYESHALVLIWLSDCVMLLWVTHSCPDLTIWLRDAVMSHTFLSWSDYLTAWCCYESHVLVLIWLSDCVMLLWVTRSCPDLTIWLDDADLVEDPHFTLARHRISSSLVVGASD